jgi:putative ABC transport system permease protein
MTPRQIVVQLRSLWNWDRKESELDEEIRFHLSEEADERAAAGLSADQARLAAKRDFGNTTLIREATRDAWGWAFTERLLQDARGALRMARRDPGFSAVAVLTLALGIGATTALLSVVNALVLRPMPFPDADRLVVLFATSPKQGVYRDTTSFHDISAWKDESHAFAGVAAYRRDRVILTGDGTPQAIGVLRGSHDLLQVLGVTPALGRTFGREEQRDTRPVALISHGLWTRRYGADPRMLDRTILLNEVSHAVIGVLPAGFEFLPFSETDVMVPVLERPCRGCGYLRAIARLKPGVAASGAQRELDAIADRRAQTFPDSNADRGVNVVPLHDVMIGPVRTPLLVLLAAGAFVLLIGCGNVANLVLARGVARQRELAVRGALGAGAGRLVRQLLTESVVLALVAAILGTGLAILGSDLLVTALSLRFPLPVVGPDWTLLAFASLIAVLAGLLSAIPVAVMVRKSDLNGALKQDGRSHSEGAAQHRLRNLLAISQTALTVMLLIGAGLLVKSFVRLQQIPIGLNASQALTADLILPSRHADQARPATFVRGLLDSVGRVPGVQAVGVHVDQPFQGGGRRESFNVEGHDDPSPGRGHPAFFNIVSGRFFVAMDVPVVRGRGFDGQDTAASAPVAIINETMARTFWPQQDAIGKRIRYFYDRNSSRWLTIVGVVGDVRYHGRLADPVRQVFVPGEQPFYKSQEPFMSVVVRTNGDPASLTKAVQASIWAVDKDLPVLDLRPMTQALGDEIAEPRIYALLLGIFAAVALAIASAGIYGLCAYAVVRRTREIGIRLAVGARPGQILALILRYGLMLILPGIAIGIAGSLALAKVMAGFLHNVAATDVPTFLVVVILFVGVAVLSTCLPARRAARTDPTVAFRYE